jgi:hypothetical protein
MRRRRTHVAFQFCSIVAIFMLAALTILPGRAAQKTEENGFLLEITDPSDGTVVNPGQTIDVAVSSPSGAAFMKVIVIGEDPIGGSDDIQEAVPADFSLKIPKDISCGRYMLTAMGVTTSRQSVSSPVVMIDVERPDVPVSLSGQMPGAQFYMVEGNQTEIILFAHFADGSVLEVTRSSYVNHSSSDAGVATVDENGMIHAVSVGKATVTASYTLIGQSISTPLQVYVQRKS